MRSPSGYSLNVLKSSNNLSIGMLGCSLLLHFSIISRIPENYSISIFGLHHNIVYSKSPVYNNLNGPGAHIKGPCLT